MTETFKHESLNVREHIDPDKHWIGEALPAASIQETKPSGSETTTGTSPFPARADHTHDNKQIFATYMHPDKTYVHGTQQYLDNWNFALGTDILNSGSHQLFVFPAQGVWQINMQLTVTGVAAAVFPSTAWIQWIYNFNNATNPVTVYIGPAANDSGLSYFYLTASFCVFYSSVSPSTNVQFLISSNVLVNSTVSSQQLQITRLSSFT